MAETQLEDLQTYIKDNEVAWQLRNDTLTPELRARLKDPHQVELFEQVFGLATTGKLELFYLNYAKRYYSVRILQYFSPNRSLPIAARNGELEVVQELLTQEKITPKYINEALPEAAGSGHFEIVTLLLERRPGELDEAISRTAEAGQAEILKLLIAYHQGRPDLPSIDYGDALLNGINGGHLEICQLLTATEPNLNFDRSVVYAAKLGRLEICIWLLNRNPSRELLVEAILGGIERGQNGIVLGLLDLAPIYKFDWQDSDGETILTAAFQNEDPEMIANLMERFGRGLCLHIIGKFTIQALRAGYMKAARVGLQWDLPNRYDLLIYAADRALVEPLELLLAHKSFSAADLSDGLLQAWTSAPLQAWAVEYLRAIRLLMDHGAQHPLVDNHHLD